MASVLLFLLAVQDKPPQQNAAKAEAGKGKNQQVRLESFFGAPVITSHAKKKEPEKGKGKGKGKAGPSGIKKPGGFKR